MEQADIRPAGDGSKQNRLFFLDNLKAALISLVVVFHAALTYGPTATWYYNEIWQPGVVSNLLLAMFFAVAQAFVISLFIAISGYFTPGTYDRKGAIRTLADRAVRLGIPAVLYNYLVNPSIVYLKYIIIEGMKIGYGDYLRDSILNNRNLSVGPLWYAALLLVITFIYVPWRLAAGLVRKPAGDRPDKGGFFGMGGIFAVTIALTIVTFLIRWRLPVAGSRLGVQLSYLVKYVCFFVIGVKAHNRGYRAIPRGHARTWSWITAVTVLLWPFMIAFGWDWANMPSYFGKTVGMLTPFLGGANWRTMLYAAWENLFAMGACICLTYWFQNRFNSQGRLAKAMSASAFAVYFLHAAIIVPLAYALRDVPLHPFLKFTVVSALGVPGSFLIGHYLRQLPVIKRIL